MKTLANSLNFCQMSHLYMSLLGCLLIPLGSAHICRTCLEIVSNLFAHFRSMLVLMMCKPHISQVSISLIDPLQKGLRGCLERQECHKKLCAACSFGWNDAMTIMIILHSKQTALGERHVLSKRILLLIRCQQSASSFLTPTEIKQEKPWYGWQNITKTPAHHFR